MVTATERQAAVDLPIFSKRLSAVLDAVLKGEAPNAGRFCGYCYTPIDPQRSQCLHCRTAVQQHLLVDRVPQEVLAMFHRHRRRESLVVNSFAYLGLLLGVLIFVAVFYLIFTLDASIWWYIFDIALLFVLSRVLAGVLGGVLGDELGFRYARRKLAQEWRAYDAQRSLSDQP